MMNNNINKEQRFGIYEGLDEQEYHKDSALGSTDIKNLLDSPLTFWRESKLNTRREQTTKQAQKIGSATHTAILEPEKFKERFIVNRKVKESKTSANKLGTKELAQVQQVKREIRRINPFVGQKKEVSIFWKINDVRCKARIDILDYGNSIIDLKTTKSVKRKDICNALYGPPLLYAVQAAHYVSGLRAIKKEKGIAIGSERFSFLFVTKDDPAEHFIADIEEDIIEQYLEDVERAVEIYKHSLDKFGSDKVWRDEEIRRDSFTMSDAPAWVNYYN